MGGRLQRAGRLPLTYFIGWGPDMLQATDQPWLLFRAGVAGGLESICFRGWSLPSGAPAVLMNSRRDVCAREGSSIRRRAA